MIQIHTPFDSFTGLDGKPLTNGKIYIGQVGTDPTVLSNQIPVFWDDALTIPAAQPLRTNAGYIVRNGTPSRVYTSIDYSMSVANSNDVLVSYVAKFGAVDYLPAGDIKGPNGASIVGYTPPGLGAVLSDVSEQLDKVFYSDNYDSLQAAHDACVDAGGGELVIVGLVEQNVAFRWNVNKVYIRGQHGIVSGINFRGMPGPGISDVDKFAFEWEDPAPVKSRKGMSNLIIMGPLASSGVSCFPLFSSVGDGITNINFDRIAIVDFETQMYYGSQCSNVNWSLCFFGNSNGDAFRTSIAIKTANSAIVNAGEGWTYSQCQFGNLNKVLENNIGVAGGWQFSQCSLVYFNTCFELNGPCRVTVTGGHIESNAYTSNWFRINGNGGIIRCSQTEFWFSGSIAKEPFYVAANVIFGGLTIRDCDYHAVDGATIIYWVDRTGGGPVHVSGWNAQDSNIRLPFARNNGVQLESFAASDVRFGQGFKADTGDMSTVAVTAAQPFFGDVTAITTATNGQTARRYKQYRIRPGDVIDGSVYLKSTGFTADGSNFAIYVTLFDSNGISITGGNPFVSSGDVTNYQKIDLNWYPTVTDGAAFYEFRVFFNPANTNTQRSVYLAEMVITSQ